MRSPRRIFESARFAENPRHPTLMVGLFLIALSLRVVAAGAMLGLGYGFDNDEYEYVDPAKNIVKGLGYSMVPQGVMPSEPPVPTAFRLPGPSLIMAGVIFVFGENRAWLCAMSILVSSLAIPLMYLYARQVLKYQTAESAVASANALENSARELSAHQLALLAALVCAVYPSWVLNSITFKSEPYFGPLLILLLMSASEAARVRTAAAGLKTGLLWGLMTYVKPYGLPMTLLGAAQFWISDRCKKYLPAILMCFGFAVMLAPWAYRNWIVFDRFIPLATEGSETFLGANNPYVVDLPENRGKWLSPVNIDEYREALRPYKTELERQQVRMDIANKYLRENPSVIPWLAFWKIKNLYSFVSGSGWLTSAVIFFTWGILFSLFVIGLIRRTFSWSAELQLVLMWFLMQSIVTMVYYSGYSRGRLPMELMLIPWALISARSLWQSLRGGRKVAGQGDGQKSAEEIVE